MIYRSIQGGQIKLQNFDKFSKIEADVNFNLIIKEEDEDKFVEEVDKLIQRYSI